MRDQAGYSLVEVMVAIMLLGLAIIPMVGMFDAGLRASVVGSNNDRGRAIASEELAEIQAMPFSNPGTAAPDSVVEFYPPTNGPEPPAALLPRTPKPCTDAAGTIPAGFDCTVTTKYFWQDGSNLVAAPGAVRTTMVQATVTVEWDSNTKSYSTTGLVSKGSQ